MSATFNVEIVGLDKLTKKYAKAPEVIEPIMQQAISKGAALLAYYTTPATVPWKTGTLARSFNPASIGRLYARWFPRVDYARALQYGMPASPGRFVPAIGKRLTNPNHPSFGMWPGFKGRQYMQKIRAAAQNDINELFRNALKAATKAMSGV